jgi:hypothetical protein
MLKNLFSPLLLFEGNNTSLSYIVASKKWLGMCPKKKWLGIYEEWP